MEARRITAQVEMEVLGVGVVAEAGPTGMAQEVLVVVPVETGVGITAAAEALAWVVGFSQIAAR